MSTEPRAPGRVGIWLSAPWKRVTFRPVSPGSPGGLRALIRARGRAGTPPARVHLRGVRRMLMRQMRQNTKIIMILVAFAFVALMVF
ncbi:MAG: hypothetical protein WD804_00300, partial [Gemmatimonadota bacterium]